MTKGIIIIGKRGSGKTSIAKEIIGDENVFKIDGKLFNPSDPFCFSGCTKETKILLIDNLPKTFNTNWLYEVFFGLIVNSKNKPFFNLKLEKIILVFDDNVTIKTLKKNGQCFIKRFNIISVE